MNSLYEKYYRISLKLIFISVLLIFIYVLIKYLLPFFAPFIAAVIIAFINEPVIKLLESKVRIPRKFAALISMLLTVSILGVLVTIGISKIYNELLDLQDNISNYIKSATDQLTMYLNRLTDYYSTLPVNVSSVIDNNIKNFTPKFEGIVTSLISHVMSAVSSIPGIALFIIVTLLSAYFISSDRFKIRDFIFKQLPVSWLKNISNVKSDAFTAVFGYVKALLFLMTLTFVEVTVGLLFIRAHYALLMGLIVAISDAVPILGTGVIMVPWIVWNLITGNMGMALGLTIIYLIGVIVRQILEPIIVGEQIGLHPLVTLCAMYVGLGVFGVPGMFIGPISVLILKSLQTSGVISLWNS